MRLLLVVRTGVRGHLHRGVVGLVADRRRTSTIGNRHLWGDRCRFRGADHRGVLWSKLVRRRLTAETKMTATITKAIQPTGRISHPAGSTVILPSECRAPLLVARADLKTTQRYLNVTD